MTKTGEVAGYASALTFDALPASAVAAAKRVVLDFLGVAVGGADTPPGRAITDYVAGTGGAPLATVIGSGVRTSTADAALANGTLAATLELDDVHPSANLHASSVFLPALLAAGEARAVSGAEWITSLVVAYDVGCRISIALDDSQQYDRGFHPTPVSGTFGAAAGVARLAGLSGEQIGQVLGLAGCQASGLLTWKLDEGRYTKAFQSGMAARNGLVAAELVAAGYAGPQDTLDASVNIFQTFSTTTNLAPLIDALGERYEVERTGFKFYGCCRGIHATLDTVLEMMGSGRLRPVERIAELTARLPHTTVPIVDGHDLLTHNLQYVLAVTLLDGGYSDDQLTADRRGEPAVKALMERIRIVGDDAMEDAYPGHWRADVTVVDIDGHTIRAERSDPRGTMAFPPTEDDMAAKFRSLAGGRLSSDALEAILDHVAHLESLDSVETLATCLRVR